MEHINTLKASLVAFFGALTAIFGWFGWLVVLFILCMAIEGRDCGTNADR